MWDDARSEFDEPFYLTRWVGPKCAVAIVLAVLYLSIRYQLEVHSDLTTNVFGLAHAKAKVFLFLGASGDAQWVFSGGGDAFLVRQDVVAAANPYAASWGHVLDRIVHGTWIAAGLLFVPPALWHSLPVMEDALARITVQRDKWRERNWSQEEQRPEPAKVPTPRRHARPKSAPDEQLLLPFDEPDQVQQAALGEAREEEWRRIVRHAEESQKRPPTPSPEPPPPLPPSVATEEPTFVPGQVRRKPKREQE